MAGIINKIVTKNNKAFYSYVLLMKIKHCYFRFLSSRWVSGWKPPGWFHIQGFQFSRLSVLQELKRRKNGNLNILLFLKIKVYFCDLLELQGVPRNMTVGGWFWMSSSIYYIRYYRLFSVYFVNKLFYSNIFYFEINFL